MTLVERDIYLISALVEKPGAMGHRARVFYFESEEEAIGSSLKMWQVDGWSVASYDCIRCDSLILPEIERLEKALETAREALEPFAEEADCYDPDTGDSDDICWATPTRFKIRELRRAREVIRALSQKKEG